MPISLAKLIAFRLLGFMEMTFAFMVIRVLIAHVGLLIFRPQRPTIWTRGIQANLKLSRRKETIEMKIVFL